MAGLRKVKKKGILGGDKGITAKARTQNLAERWQKKILKPNKKRQVSPERRDLSQNLCVTNLNSTEGMANAVSWSGQKQKETYPSGKEPMHGRSTHAGSPSLDFGPKRIGWKTEGKQRVRYSGSKPWRSTGPPKNLKTLFRQTVPKDPVGR